MNKSKKWWFIQKNTYLIYKPLFANVIQCKANMLLLMEKVNLPQNLHVIPRVCWCHLRHANNKLHQHSCTDYTRAFNREAFELAFTTGPHFVPVGFYRDTQWICSLQQKGWSQDNKKTPLLLVFDKSSTPAEGEDTEVVATALGISQGLLREI